MPILQTLRRMLSLALTPLSLPASDPFVWNVVAGLKEKETRLSYLEVLYDFLNEQSFFNVNENGSGSGSGRGDRGDGEDQDAAWKYLTYVAENILNRKWTYAEDECSVLVDVAEIGYQKRKLIDALYWIATLIRSDYSDD